MAEIATIARPYAEALFKADGIADLGVLADELQALADVAGEAQLRQFADNPKVTAEQVFDLVTSVARPDGSAWLTPSTVAAKGSLLLLSTSGSLTKPWTSPRRAQLLSAAAGSLAGR